MILKNLFSRFSTWFYIFLVGTYFIFYMIDPVSMKTLITLPWTWNFIALGICAVMISSENETIHIIGNFMMFSVALWCCIDIVVLGIKFYIYLSTHGMEGISEYLKECLTQW